MGINKSKVSEVVQQYIRNEIVDKIISFEIVEEEVEGFEWLMG